MDLHVINEGSIFLVEPITPAGKQWLEESVITSDTLTWGRAIVVEHRYIRDIVDGARADGLEV